MKNPVHFQLFTLLIITVIFTPTVKGQNNDLLLIYETNISPLASAENIATIRQGFFNLEDQFLPNQLTTSKKWMNVGYRLLKIGTLNRFLDNAALVVQHEQFGHVYRYKEFGYTRNSVNIRITPLGFAGFARRGTPTFNRNPSLQELAMVGMGGIEATTLLSETLFQHWVRDGQISLYDAQLYVSSFRTPLFATTSYEDDLRSDTELYLDWINNSYGFWDIDSYPLSLEKITRQSLVELLNPYLYFTIYAFVKNYLWEGQEKVPLPMLQLGNIQYMPYLKYWLTPFGGEFQVNNVLKTEKRIFRFQFRIGDNTFDQAAWGTGIFIEHLFQNHWIRFSPDLNCWYQQALALSEVGTTNLKEAGFGGALRLHTDFTFLKNPTHPEQQTHLYINVGYKTAGYLQGEALAEQFIGRFGLKFTY